MTSQRTKDEIVFEAHVPDPSAYTRPARCMGSADPSLWDYSVEGEKPKSRERQERFQRAAEECLNCRAYLECLEAINSLSHTRDVSGVWAGDLFDESRSIAKCRRETITLPEHPTAPTRSELRAKYRPLDVARKHLG